MVHDVFLDLTVVVADYGQTELFNSPPSNNVPENEETTIIKIDITQHGQVMCCNNNNGQSHPKPTITHIPYMCIYAGVVMAQD